MYLGPVVAAQQVLDPPLRLVILGKKRRGAHPLQPSLQESNPTVKVYDYFLRMLW